MSNISDIIFPGDKMKKSVLFFSILLSSIFLFASNVFAVNKIYFESDDLNIKPDSTKEIDVYLESDNDFNNLELNFITTSSYVSFYSIEYNDSFTRSINNGLTNLNSKESLKSGLKVATIKLKASNNAPINATGYIKAVNVTLDNDIKLNNASLLVKVSNNVSSNTYLKSITSDIVSLDFNKDTTNYEVEVDNNIDKLDIKAVAEDSSSLVSISSQVLKNNKTTINITVTAENKDEKVYTIVVNKKNKSNTSLKDKKVKVSQETKKPSKAGFAFVLILLVCVLLVDLFYIKNKKNK